VNEGELQDESERYLETINRLTYRPVYTSPVTLRFDMSDLRQRTEDDTIGTTRRLLPSLEWERRWSHDLVTKIRFEVPIRLLDDALEEQLGILISFREYALSPWAEVRVRLKDFWRQSLLRMTVRASMKWVDWFESGRGAERAWEVSSALWLDWEKAGAFIVRLGTIYTRHRCLDRVAIPCASFHSVQPSIKAIVRF
jgi:hypothetical protein